MDHPVEAVLRRAIELLGPIPRIATVPRILCADCTTLGRRLLVAAIRCISRVVGGLVVRNALSHLHLPYRVLQHRHFLLEALSLLAELSIVALEGEFILAGHARRHS